MLLNLLIHQVITLQENFTFCGSPPFFNGKPYTFPTSVVRVYLCLLFVCLLVSQPTFDNSCNLLFYIIAFTIYSCPLVVFVTNYLVPFCMHAISHGHLTHLLQTLHLFFYRFSQTPRPTHTYTRPHTKEVEWILLKDLLLCSHTPRMIDSTTTPSFYANGMLQ